MHAARAAFSYSALPAGKFTLSLPGGASSRSQSRKGKSRVLDPRYAVPCRCISVLKQKRSDSGLASHFGRSSPGWSLNVVSELPSELAVLVCAVPLNVASSRPGWIEADCGLRSRNESRLSK